MATSAYISGRKKYARPQAMLWSDSAGTLSNGIWVPDGTENQDFIILSDHSRQPISVANQRIENKQRMINGRMRSYFIADKVSFSTSWQRLPSRSYSSAPTFNSSGKYNGTGVEYTVDGGAGGSDMYDWYKSHSGPFWVYLSYDKDATSLNIYNDRRLMFFSSFEFSVEKRGATNHDLWNINVTLEEA